MQLESKQGFTLLEMLVVVIIVGVLAGIGLPNYMRMKEHTYGQEAKANLKLISAAEKIYKLENSAYYYSGSTVSLNDNLKLALPTSNSIWSYNVVNASGNFTATATRVSGSWSGCQFTINHILDDPTGNCP